MSAIAPLISVILSTLFVYIAHADREGVAIVSTFTNVNLSYQCFFIESLILSVSSSQVKHIEKGINPPSVNEIYFSGENLLKGFRIGIVAGMIALTVGASQVFRLSHQMARLGHG